MRENLICKTVWILQAIRRFGIQSFKRLREELSDISQLYNKDVLNDVSAKLGFGENFVRDFESIEASAQYERTLEICARKGIDIVSVLDNCYPKNLAAIFDPPLILYVKGVFIPEDEVALAIVGTRHPTTYGLKVSNQFSSRLAEHGITVVSGLAKGIDGQAHLGALQVKGRTIAVLGSGVDVIYPKEHKSLYERISENGAVVSEFPLGTGPEPHQFPMRNRIINGLSRGVLVVEASERSGSLITASLAAEEGREVYVIPGPIDSITSMGTNKLIQSGAKLITQPNEILEDLCPQIKASLDSFQGGVLVEEKDSVQGELIGNSVITGNKIAIETGKDCSPVCDDNPLLKLLQKESLYFDELLSFAHKKADDLRLDLIKMEMAGTIKKDFGGLYHKV